MCLVVVEVVVGAGGGPGPSSRASVSGADLFRHWGTLRMQ